MTIFKFNFKKHFQQGLQSINSQKKQLNKLISIVLQDQDSTTSFELNFMIVQIKLILLQPKVPMIAIQKWIFLKNLKPKICMLIQIFLVFLNIHPFLFYFKSKWRPFKINIQSWLIGL
ncbi:unnamed protein product [Paramecium sonneborni]|uniref:Transmembrane protein n=1 Tax=Paramecium sonneborni TaxID=65129 RepID=A0A8S1PL44_9CILI|nr:unnamed protein product [Paramecium sonneborni]